MTQTFYSMRAFHMVTGVVLAVGGFGFIVLAAVASAHPHIHFFQADGGESTSDIVGSFFLGAAFAWIGIRMVRVGVRISAEKITIRGYFRTRTVEASEIRAVSLQPAAGESGPRWLPRVELAGGKDFWIYSFDCGSASKPPKSDKAATIQQVRALLGVETPDLGGEPGVPDEDDRERAAVPGTTAGISPAQAAKLRIGAGTVAIAGAAAAVVACALPIYHFRRVSLSIFSGHLSYYTSALELEPVAVAAIGITAAVMLIAAKGLGSRWLATGMLLASGIQTIALFYGYQRSPFPPARPGIAAAIGIVGGATLLAAGVMNAIALTSKSTAARPIPSEQA